MDPSTGCSALEDLAAFAEGRLRGAERERVIDHLAGCADCREVLAESMETTDELEAEGGPAPVAELRPVASPRPGRFGWLARATSLAAAALVAVGAVVMWQANARRSPPDRSEWLAAMPSAEELAPHVWGGVVMRGEGDFGEQGRWSTELGALLVDVDVALAAGEVERARDFLHRMATIFDDAGYMERFVEVLRATAEIDDVEEMKARLTAHLPELEEAMRERFDPFFLDLGTFLNEAQLAARTGRRDFLDAPETRRYVEWLLSQGHERLSDAILNRVQAWRDELSEDELEARVELLQPVRDELLVLRDTSATPAARGEAARQVLDALTG